MKREVLGVRQIPIYPLTPYPLPLTSAGPYPLPLTPRLATFAS